MKRGRENLKQKNVKIGKNWNYFPNIGNFYNLQEVKKKFLGSDPKLIHKDLSALELKNAHFFSSQLGICAPNLDIVVLVLILDDNSEISAKVRNNLCY